MSVADTESPAVYHLRPLDIHRRIIEVQCRIRSPDPAGQVLSWPAWTPGSYLVRDFARHVLSLVATDRDGREVTLRKTDKATWRAVPIVGELVLSAQIYAADPSVRGACLDRSGLFINGASVFIRIHGLENERHVVHVSPGDQAGVESWEVATTLARLTGAEWEFGAFEAASYEELIDHPILVGAVSRDEFTAEGVSHAIVLAGSHDADLDRVTSDLATLCGHQIRFFGGAVPISRYLFLVRLNGEGFGGLEHRCSTALVCHRDDLPCVGATTADSRYRKFLGLASHEYFHLWNGKRIRPAEFVSHEIDREVYTRQLWIVEGITSYYDDLMLLRAGLISVQAYLEALGQLLTSVFRTPGRVRQTLEEASFDAWIKHYRPDENSPNSQVSYYRKGAMVALALDLEVRLRTQGRISLDDIMRVLWRTHGDAGHGLAEGVFEEIAAETSGLDLGDFFRTALRTTQDPPVGILLAQFGVRLNMRRATGHGDAGGTAGAPDEAARAWLGIRIRSDHGRVIVKHVLDDGPAQRAGLVPNDELVAIAGRRIGTASLAEVTRRLRTDQPVEMYLLRREELLRVYIRPGEAPRDTCYLTLDQQATGDALSRRQQWLGFSGG